jgi:hypothetical protein
MLRFYEPLWTALSPRAPPGSLSALFLTALSCSDTASPTQKPFIGTRGENAKEKQKEKQVESRKMVFIYFSPFRFLVSVDK